jgi:hypothetical protein
MNIVVPELTARDSNEWSDTTHGSGRETYDGQGHIKYSQLWDESGVTYTYTGTGTYTMSSDCVATAAYGLENHWTYFVAPDGNVFYFNNNNNTGVMSAGHEERISRGLLF